MLDVEPSSRTRKATRCINASSSLGSSWRIITSKDSPLCTRCVHCAEEDSDCASVYKCKLAGCLLFVVIRRAHSKAKALTNEMQQPTSTHQKK